jgi:hypothetical protein
MTLPQTFGYSYPINKQAFKIMCERVCRAAGASLPTKQRKAGTTHTLKSTLNKKTVYLFMTPWLMSSTQMIDVAFFCVIVVDDKNIKDARHYYVSLCKPETIDRISHLAIDQNAVADKLLAFLEDSQKPLSEATYLPVENATENFGGWNGGLQRLPSSWTGADPFVKPVQ